MQIRPSLKSQIVALVVAVVLVSVGTVGFFAAQEIANNAESATRSNVEHLAQLVAENPEIKAGFSAPDPAAVITPIAQRIRRSSGVEFVVVMNMQGIRYSHFNPDLIGKRFTGGDEGPALLGQSYVSKAVGISGPSLRAFAPIFGPDQRQIGVAAVGVFTNTLAGSIGQMVKPVYLASGAGLAIGVLGAILLAYRVKRTIFGLEPSEIATLLQEREAILRSTREGILAIDRNARITLINEEARRLLGIGPDAVGRPVEEVVPTGRLGVVVQTGKAEYDQQQVVGSTILLTNRVPIVVGKETVGAVATFRDKSELQRLAEELTGVRKFAEGLRALAHEFANKLQTISGLIQLGSYDEAARFISQFSRAEQNLIQSVSRRIKEPTVAGLILGKISQARERGVEVIVDPSSRLGQLANPLESSALVTIVGNLVENAVEAVERKLRAGAGGEGPGGNWLPGVRLLLRETPREITCAVSDTGPGVPPGQEALIFERGFSTKEKGSGLGLAFARDEVLRAGGRIRVSSASDGGATFVVSIPKRSTPKECSQSGGVGSGVQDQGLDRRR